MMKWEKKLSERHDKSKIERQLIDEKRDQQNQLKE